MKPLYQYADHEPPSWSWVSLPASAFLTTIGGYLFGWALGGTVASMAATLGATSIFLIARSSLGAPLLRRAGSRIPVRIIDGAHNWDAFKQLLPDAMRYVFQTVRRPELVNGASQ